MIHDLIPFLIVCPLVFLAGLVDSIAGGGGLISLPAYVVAGLPMHSAVATNKLSSSIGTVFSTIRYCKNKCFHLGLGIMGIITALIGSTIGARLSLIVSEKILRYILIIVLPVIAFLVLRKKNTDDEKKEINKTLQYIIVGVFSLLIGAYDGFYGPGTGTFLLLVYTAFAKMDVKTASGNVKLVNLSSNLAALVTFVIHGKIFFLLGLCASIFSIAGHLTGSGLVLKKGSKIVKPIMIVVLILLMIKIITEMI